MQHLFHWAVFIVAACLEVGGDLVIRKGLKGVGIPLVLGGAALLGLYGVIVNSVDMDFSKLLGIYVAAFATVSVLAGWYLLGETIPLATKVGLAMIVAGGLVIQFGSKYL